MVHLCIKEFYCILLGEDLGPTLFYGAHTNKCVFIRWVIRNLYYTGIRTTYFEGLYKRVVENLVELMYGHCSALIS